jgi:mRNA interferase MazF
MPPMTSQIKNDPFKVVVAGEIPSVVLADQVKTFDWRRRRPPARGFYPFCRELAEVRIKPD